jgi:hypothetical protein
MPGVGYAIDDHLHRHAAFPDGGCDAFYAARAFVADG